MSTSLFACSIEGEKFSPEQVIQNTLADTDKMPAYYGESVMTFSDGTESINMKEWVAEDGKRRVETETLKTGEKATTVNDGAKLTTYEEATNKAFVIDMSEDDAQMKISPKEQAEILLNTIKDTHTITLVGEEKLIGRDVYHLKAEVMNKESLYGDQEIWVDKANWFILKTVSKSGDSQVSIEYKKIDFDPTLKDSLFKLELPKDVEITDISAMTKEQVVESLDEAVEMMEKPFLYVKEEDGLTIKQMSVMSLESEVNPELTINYFKDDQPYFSLSVFAIDEENIAFDGEGENIRGFKGGKTDIEGFRVLNWAEDGFGYSVIMTNPDLTFEQMHELLNSMGYVQVK